MPSTRHKRTRKNRSLNTGERAFLENDESLIRPDSRDMPQFKMLLVDWDRWLIYGHRTRRMLFDQFPEYRKSIIQRFGEPPAEIDRHAQLYYSNVGGK